MEVAGRRIQESLVAIKSGDHQRMTLLGGTNRSSSSCRCMVVASQENTRVACGNQERRSSANDPPGRHQSVLFILRLRKEGIKPWSVCPYTVWLHNRHLKEVGRVRG